MITTFVKNGIVTSANFNEIPEAYKRLEYISSETSNKSVYIDTGVQGSSNLVIRCRFLMYSTGTIFGYRDPNNLEGINFRLFLYNNNWYLDYGTGSGGNRIKGSSYSLNTIYDVEVGNRYVKNLNTNSNIISGTSVSAWSQTPTIGLFGADIWNESSYCDGRIYFFSIMSGGEYIRYMIPVKRISDGVAGMYDLVYGNFYHNDSTSTNEFSAGPEINTQKVSISSDRVIVNNFIEI